MADVVLLVSGSRSLVNSSHYCYNCIQHALKSQNIEPYQVKLLLNGAAEGVDAAAIEWASAQNPPVPVKLFRPDWKQHPKNAGIFRNEEMVNLATHVITIWDMESPGTKHVNDIARKANKLIGFFDASSRLK